jgi:hypothetical protein
MTAISRGHHEPVVPAAARALHRRGWVRWTLGVVLVVGVVLVGARVALPYWLESYVNRTIDRSPDYTGGIGEVDVHLWRGAYTVHDMRVFKRTHSVPVPFFECPRLDFSLFWGALAHGQARGKIRMEKPRLNFVHGPTSEESQTGSDQPWLGIVDDLYPFRIDRADIVDGDIHFEAFHKDPQVDVYLSQVNGRLENLTNVENTTDPLIATITASGRVMESGRLEFRMDMDPRSRLPTFDLALRLVDMDVRRLNALALAYGDFDFEEGWFDLVLELSAREGHVEGYAKPLFRGLRVLSVKDVRADTPLQLLWETLVGVVGAVFKNQERDQFGTRLTLAGDLDDPRTNILEIVGNVLRNAFVRAYLPRIEGRVAPGLTPADTDVSR